MRCEWNSQSFKISDVRDWRNRNLLEIRPYFQRNLVWSDAAKIMLIDTILKNIPMPKFFFRAEIRKKDTYRIVIDGQQRITTVLEFVDNKFKLSAPYQGEYLGLSFEQLPPDIQILILSYKLDVNEIVGADDVMIRDIFSRVNKYTKVLNNQELRRADFPGEFLALSDRLANHEFFERHRFFSVAARKRMLDAEYVSELLIVLLGGVQDKATQIDNFYFKYMQWPIEERTLVRERFERILTEVQIIFAAKKTSLDSSRFKQKADFYSLFAAIDKLHRGGGVINENNIKLLGKDLDILDDWIAPEAEVKVFSEYAIKCVSQANTLRSREWRSLFLYDFLRGSYFCGNPCKSSVKRFFDLYNDILTSDIDEIILQPCVCDICGDRVESDIFIENAVLCWPKTERVFQFSNSLLCHKACFEQNKAKYWEAQ